MLSLHTIFILFCLILLLLNVLHRQFLLECLTALIFHHLVPLWTANRRLILSIGIVIDCISLLHIEELLLVAISYCSYGCVSFLFASHKVKVILLFSVLHEPKITLAEKLLPRFFHQGLLIA